MGDGAGDQLTGRERDCLALVATGRSSKEIAAALGISHHTVDLHLKRAMRTLGAATRRDAARRYEEMSAPNQLLDTQPRTIADRASGGLKSEPDRIEVPARFRVPFLRQGRRLNDLTPMRRLGWIAGLGFAMLLAAANFLNGLGALFAIAD